MSTPVYTWCTQFALHDEEEFGVLLNIIIDRSSENILLGIPTAKSVKT